MTDLQIHQAKKKKGRQHGFLQQIHVPMRERVQLFGASPVIDIHNHRMCD